MKKLSLILVVLLIASCVSFGQSLRYGYDGPFPADSNAYKLIGGIVNNGIGVDPAGKVWIQCRSENTTRDSIATPEGGKARLFPILVFNSNGTQASFSPIRILTGPDQTNVTVTDTLIRGGATGGGINPKNGNFVAVWGNLSYKPGPLIWEVNYRTGQGARRILLSPSSSGTQVLQNNIASAAMNQDGEYFLCSVLSGSVGQILNPDGTLGTQYSAAVPAIGRTIAVSANGNDVYVPRFTDWKTYVYHSDNGSLGPYTLKDSILLGMSTECIAIHPKTGYVWVSNDRRAIKDSLVLKRTWTPNMFYAYNPATKAIVDSFDVGTVWDKGNSGPLPRGIAFSPTGDTVYVAHFDVSSMPAVIRFVKGKAVSVERQEGIPTEYALSQNFPNPFNPSTQIRFSLAKPGLTTLKVYDVMGREVRTLVNETMSAGSYSVSFEASHLASGTYMYVLTSGSTRLANKMVLVK